MADEQPLLMILPLLDETVVTRARALVAAGFYEETGRDTYRLTEAGLQWIVSWLPRVIPTLIARGRTPEMERLIRLERENLDLRVQIEEMRRGIRSPHRAALLKGEEE